MLLCASLAIGCSTAEKDPEDNRAAGGGGTVVSSDGGGAQTALADTVRFGGVLYEARFYEGAGRPLGESDLGEKYGEVRYRLASYDDPDHEPADGDAAYLRPGTPVYAVEGYDPSFWLAARQEGHLRLYEAVFNPKADEGSDLLDIGGKVRRMDVTNWEDTGKVYGSFDDPEEVGSLVRGLMRAPLEQTDPDHFGMENAYLVVLHLRDGMAVAREYRTDTGRQAPGIVTSEGFREAIWESLEGLRADRRAVREATVVKELRQAKTCDDPRASSGSRKIDRGGVFYATNDEPGGPWAGTLRGTDGRDRLAGEDGEDEVYGLGGDDTVEGGACGDEMWGGLGDDDLMGAGAMDPDEGGDDVLHGGLGRDNVGGDSGDDVLYGDAGDDGWLFGGGGEDVLYGGEGNDLLDAGRDGKRDRLHCGGGRDSYVADENDVVADDCEIETKMMVQGAS